MIYDWVSYPITLMIQGIYKTKMQRIDKNKLPCLLCLELLASFEQLLCDCHTGNTAVFATSLMNGLGLSRGSLKDGFPVLLDTFEHPLIMVAREHGFKVDLKHWPLKSGFPAVASRKAQVLTYLDAHYLVSVIYTYLTLQVGSDPIRRWKVFLSVGRKCSYPRVGSVPTRGSLSLIMLCSYLFS